jgi:Flavin containing amine oxidoreductase
MKYIYRMDTYDVMIVGAGFAGLHCAMRISENNPQLKIGIAEMYGYMGGRAITYAAPGHKDIHWEGGAGRIHSSHTMTIKYVERYGLHLIPISSEQDWVKDGLDGYITKNIWEECAEFLISFLSALQPRILATHTIQQLLQISHGKTLSDQILAHFPYKAETHTLRADLAIQSLKKEMKNNKDFFVIQEGFSALTTGMYKELEGRGVRFLLNHHLLEVSKNSFGQSVCKFNGSSLKASKLILAVDSKGLKKIKPFSNLPILKHLTMEPLLRTYAIFPTPAWFAGFNNIVTDSPIRHIIPVNPKKGAIMISYTDSDDAKYWFKVLEQKGEKGLGKEIMKEVRHLFPMTKIPDPLVFKSYDWHTGCTYWLPGLYNPEVLSKKIMKPFLTYNIYVCGESYSMRQAWVEGALEHSEEMLRKFFIR